jgi:hypothetical protein
MSSKRADMWKRISGVISISLAWMLPLADAVNIVCVDRI